jgi:hypothetical protein
MEFLVKLKTVYGNEVVYPACDTSRKFAELLGTKTITPHALKIIRELGYNVEAVFPEETYQIVMGKSHGVTRWRDISGANAPKKGG